VVGVTLAAWCVPGLGHWLLGRRGKAVFFLLAIWGAFVTGWVLSDFRAVFWKTDRIATYAQLGMGVPTVPLLLEGEAFVEGFGLLELEADEKLYEPTGSSENLLPYYDVGVLYVSVAGLLNVVVILNAIALACWGAPAAAVAPPAAEEGRDDA